MPRFFYIWHIGILKVCSNGIMGSKYGIVMAVIEYRHKFIRKVNNGNLLKLCTSANYNVQLMLPVVFLCQYSNLFKNSVLSFETSEEYFGSNQIKCSAPFNV